MVNVINVNSQTDKKVNFGTYIIPNNFLGKDCVFT